MVHDRGHMQGVACHTVFGIPSYYRLHNYEYAVHHGRMAVTSVRDLPDYLIRTEQTDLETSIDLHSSKWNFRIRDAVEADVARLCTLWENPKLFSDLWTTSTSPETFQDHVAWAVGVRNAPEYCRGLKADGPTPFWVLERYASSNTSECNADQAVIVAAVLLAALPDAKSNCPSISVLKFMWDQDSDAGVILDQMIRHIVLRSNQSLRASAVTTVHFAGHRLGSHTIAPKLEKISWWLPAGHELMRTLKTLDYASEVTKPGSYQNMTDQYVNIVSLVDFLTSIREALNARLSRAGPTILGRAYACSIHIQTPRSSYVGATIVIRNCAIEAIEAFPFLPVHRQFVSRHFDAQGGYHVNDPMVEGGSEMTPGPNVIMPQGPLTQMLMGYKSWKELKESSPDVMIHRSVIRVIEILFPKIVKAG